MISRHRNIPFTCEEESNDKILFLDISKSANKLHERFNWYFAINQSYDIYADYSILYDENKYLKAIL